MSYLFLQRLEDVCWLIVESFFFLSFFYFIFAWEPAHLIFGIPTPISGQGLKVQMRKSVSALQMSVLLPVFSMLTNYPNDYTPGSADAEQGH